MKKFILIFSLASTALIILIFFAFYRYQDNKLHVIMCDVGQGDSLLIITPSQAQILIDGGPDKSVLECLSRHMPFWDRSLDAIILTHPHADHAFGLIDVIERYDLKAFYTENVKPDSDAHKLLEAKLAEKKLSAKDLAINDILKEKSGVKIKILWPRLDTIQESDHNISNLDLNGLSVVVLLTYGNFSALLTGDASEKVMDQIAGEAGDIDILKVPHHGSKTGINDLFLNYVKPEIALISVGQNNYGHPSKKSLDQLEKNKIKVLRTDKNGEIEIISNVSDYSIKTLNK